MHENDERKQRQIMDLEATQIPLGANIPVIPGNHHSPLLASNIPALQTHRHLTFVTRKKTHCCDTISHRTTFDVE